MRIALLAGVLAVGALLPGLGGASPPEGEPAPCSPLGERSWTDDTLRDWVSFADQLAVIEAVKEARTPPPDGPEGYAGYIGRRVTVRVERTLWRRPRAPSAPPTFRFVDWGWFGTLEDPHPTRICGVTRLELGRRYLAPISRYHGAWIPWDDGRLRLEGDLVVGGVDGGEATFAHQELSGRRVARLGVGAGSVRRLLGRNRLIFFLQAMALNIKDDRADRLARELAAETGESITTAVTVAVRERLERLRGAVPREQRRRELAHIAKRSSERRVRDRRRADEILGYGPDGLAS